MDITNPGLYPGEVTTDKIADGAVTSAKLVDGAVTSAKLSTNTYNFASGGSVAYQDDNTIIINPADGGILQCVSNGGITKYLADRFGTGENTWNMSPSSGPELTIPNGAIASITQDNGDLGALKCASVALGSSGNAVASAGPWVLVFGPQPWGSGNTIEVAATYGEGFYLLTTSSDAIAGIIFASTHTGSIIKIGTTSLNSLLVGPSIENTSGGNIDNFEIYKWG